MRLKTLVLMAAVVGLGCGGKTLNTDGSAGATGSAGSTASAGATGSAGSTGSAGAAGSTAGTGGVTGAGGAAGVPAHRPVAMACNPTPSSTFQPDRADAGVVSCTIDNGCRTDAGVPTWAAYCHDHVCTPDQCLTDADCGAGKACDCSRNFGHGVHANTCVATGCLVDADCASGLCSPTSGGACGFFVGYRCRSAADTCHSDTDCPSRFTGDVTIPRSCQFPPEVGHWQCADVSICLG